MMLGHYIPRRTSSPVEKEYVHPVPEDYFIWWLFKYKCVSCHKPATEINEIVPRSRSKKSILNWKNRVTLCHGHHMEFHRNGVTDNKISEMNKKRREFLKSVGREEYA